MSEQQPQRGETSDPGNQALMPHAENSEIAVPGISQICEKNFAINWFLRFVEKSNYVYKWYMRASNGNIYLGVLYSAYK